MAAQVSPHHTRSMTDAPSTPAGNPAGTPNPSYSGSFFDWTRGLGVRRSDDRWLAGVAGGIAAHTRLDPLIIRGVLLVVAILGGPVFFLYAVAWALLPDSQGRIHLEQAIKGIFEPAMIAIGVLVVFTFIPFMQGVWWRGVPDWWNMPGWLEATLRTGWILALIAGLIWLTVFIARRMPRGPVPAQPTSHAGYWANATPAPGAPEFATPAPSTTASAGAPAPGATPADATTAFATAATATAPVDGDPSAPADASQPFAAPAAAPSSTAAPSTTWYGTPAAAHSGHQGISPAEREAQRRQRDAVRAEQRRQHEELYRRRQPGAAYVSISLGLAVVIGALAPLLVGYREWSGEALVVGLGTALGVLAIATIISGIRGKESGALGFFSVVAIIAILFAGVFPRGTAVSVVGNTTWVVSDAGEGEPAGYAMIAGSPTLDLTGLDARSAEVGGTVDLWLVAGSVHVVLPDDVPVIIEVNGLVAGLNYVDEDGDDHSRGGVFYRDEVRHGLTASPDTTTVRIWVAAAGVNVTDTLRSER